MAPVRIVTDGATHQRDRIFLLGATTGLVAYHAFPKRTATIVGTGFCGGYTTFSTLTLESVRLLEDGSAQEGWANAAGSLVAGIAAAALGLALAAAL